MHLAPYLLFEGNCREAMDFYSQCFDGLLECVTYGECPPNEPNPPRSASGKDDELIYSALRDNETLLPFITAADVPFGGTAPMNNGQVTIDCTSDNQIERLFQLLSHEGQIIQPLTNVFWSARIGKIVDKYGVFWLLSYQVD